MASDLELPSGDVWGVRRVPGGGRPVLRGLRRSSGGMPFVRRAGRARPAFLPSLRLRGGGGEPVAERRVCSVLFCDVVGFTTLSEFRDPEAVRELLSEYFRVARTVIERYGGGGGEVIWGGGGGVGG